jgi:hypothetical protein
MNHPDIIANIADVKRIFREACSAGSEVDDATKAKLSAALQAI